MGKFYIPRQQVLGVALLFFGIGYMACLCSSSVPPDTINYDGVRIYWATGEPVDVSKKMPNGRYYVKTPKNKATTLTINE